MRNRTRRASRTIRSVRPVRRRALRDRPGALNPAAKQIRKLQEQLQAGEITSDEFESYMEQLEAEQRHSHVAMRAIARARQTAARYAAAAADRSAAVDSADVVLLQNAIKQLGSVKDAESAVALLRDIVDAAGEMMTELGG